MGTYICTQDGQPITGTNRFPVESTPTTGTSSWTIAQGAQVSTGYVDLGGKSLVALYVPNGYASGNITIQSCDTAGGTYADVYDSDGVQVTVAVSGTVTGGRVVSLVGSALQAVSSLRYVKVKSAQATSAERVIKAITKG